MSKLKAKQKAEKRAAKRLKEQKAKEKRIEAQKHRQANLAQEQLERNAKQTVFQQIKKLKENALKPATLNSPKAKKAFQEICKSIGDNKRLAYDFVLEEIEAARIGNDLAAKFANASGILKEECDNSMDRNISAVENGPQALILQYSSAYFVKGDINGGVKFRTSVVDAVMQKYLIGKYAPTNIVETEQAAVEILFREYLDSIKKPSKNTGADLAQSFLAVVNSINKPTVELKNHILAMEIIVNAGKRFKAAIIPDEILSTLITDLGIVCVSKVKYFHAALKYLADKGVPQDDLIQAIELFREIKPLGQTELDLAYINAAPAICNAMSLFYLELDENHPCKDMCKDLMHDTSMVEGALRGAINNDIYEWVKSI